MIREKKFYIIDLEDYSLPRYASATRSYCGTMEELENFADLLDTNLLAQERYHQIIEGISFYDCDYDMTHLVAGKELPLLTPAETLAHRISILANPRWQYTAHSGAIYAMQASKIHMSRLLLKHPDGTISRWVKADFEGLMFCIHNIGWGYPNDDIKGFPGTVIWQNNIHKGQLYVQVGTYDEDLIGDALQDLCAVREEDLSAVCRDIIGED